MKTYEYSPADNARLQWAGQLINGEAKMLAVAVAIDTFDDQPFRPSALFTELMRRQGSPSAWQPDVYGPFSYCNSLRGIIFEPGPHGRQPCRLLPDIKERALGACGLGMQWALRYPRIPLHQLLGKSASGRASQPAEMRLKLFAALLDNPGPQRQVTLSTGIQWDARLLQKNADRLAALGVIRVNKETRRPLSTIELHPDFIDPITALHDRFYSNTELGASDNAALAETIINHEPSVYILMAKALHGSTSSNLRKAQGEEELPDILIRLAATLGEMTVNQALAEVAIETGHVLNRGTLDTALAYLKGKGQLVAVAKPSP